MKHTDLKMPLLFKLWFAFVALIAVCIVAISISVAVSIANDPGQIGRFAGEVVRGFDEGRERE